MAQEVGQVISQVDPNAEKAPDVEFKFEYQENKITTEEIEVHIKAKNKSGGTYIISELSLELPNSLLRSPNQRRIEFIPSSPAFTLGKPISAQEAVFHATIPESSTYNFFKLYCIPSTTHDIKINSIYTSLSGKAGSNSIENSEIKTRDPYFTLLLWGMIGALVINAFIYFYFYHVHKFDIKPKDLLVFFTVGSLTYIIFLTFNDNQVDIISKIGFSYKINTKTGAFLLGLMMNLATDAIIKTLFNKKDGDKYPTIIGKKFKRRVGRSVKRKENPPSSTPSIG